MGTLVVAPRFRDSSSFASAASFTVAYRHSTEHVRLARVAVRRQGDKAVLYVGAAHHHRLAGGVADLQHLAASKGQGEVVKVVLGHGVDPVGKEAESRRPRPR